MLRWAANLLELNPNGDFESTCALLSSTTYENVLFDILIEKSWKRGLRSLGSCGRGAWLERETENAKPKKIDRKYSVANFGSGMWGQCF